MKDKYRKEVLTPLRRQTEIVKSFIGSQNWEEINYNRTWTVVLCERWHPIAHLLHDDLPNLERGVICYIMLNYQRLPSFSMLFYCDCDWHTCWRTEFVSQHLNSGSEICDLNLSDVFLKTNWLHPDMLLEVLEQFRRVLETLVLCFP